MGKMEKSEAKLERAESQSGRERRKKINPLMKQRQQKAADLRELGGNPYRNDRLPEHTSATVRDRFADFCPSKEPGSPEPLADDRFSLAGRIVEFRSFGKATFFKLQDRHGRLQVYVRRDIVGEDVYRLFKKSEAWDFVWVRGFAFFTKTGELTLMAEDISLITKTVRPPPEKWSGLKDHETRYRQRYVDLVANPDVAQVFRTRARIIRFLRDYLDGLEFLEVETPILHLTLGGAAARPFRTHHNALDMPLVMRIAPELHLKRLVVGGFDRVYEIGRVFRNEGLSRTHNPEFTMLEFYRAYATYETLMDMTEDMLSALIVELKGRPQLTYQGTEIDFSRPWPRVRLVDAVVNAGRKLSPVLDQSTVENDQALAEWCVAAGLTARNDALGDALRGVADHGKRLGALFDHLGEAELPTNRPTFVTDYPAAMSPLSRRQDSDARFVDRFELFVMGSEMANAFSELNDPADQRLRFESQVADRQAGDDEAMEYDEDYCRALEYGLPPTAGEGIGIDRLVMLLCDQPTIRDVLLFPHLRPEVD